MNYVNNSQGPTGGYIRPLAASLAALLVALSLTAPASAQPATPTPTPGPPQLTLPTPPGERWKVIQGYNCGSHDGWGRLSFDLVNSAGRTRAAPVLAAADGTFWYWGEQSGTLLISHGDGYYTMYTHMQSQIDLPRGTPIARGTQIGTVGSAGAEHTLPHLHFTFFQGQRPGTDSREPLELRFADGLDFPDDGSCNQHAGTMVQAPAPPQPAPAPRLRQTGLPGCPLLAEAKFTPPCAL